MSDKLLAFFLDDNSLHCAVVDAEGGLNDQKKFELLAAEASTLEALKDHSDAFLQNHGGQKAFRAAGISISPQTELNSVKARQTIFFATGLDTTLISSTAASGLAESLWGSGRELKDWSYLSLSDSIRFAVCLHERRILEPDIAHTVLYPGGRTCSCGRGGCLKRYLGAQGVRETSENFLLKNNWESCLKDMSRGELTRVDLPMLSAAADAGDKTALAIWQEILEQLDSQLKDLRAIFGPIAIILRTADPRCTADMARDLPSDNILEAEVMNPELTGAAAAAVKMLEAG